MKTEIQPFDFRGNQVRIVMHDGEPWFVGNDVCSALEIQDPRQAVSRLDEDERDGCVVPTPSGPQQMRVVSEAGLYRLILTARTEPAKPFQRWVTHEVLPTLRKTGAYVMDGVQTKRTQQIDAYVETSRMFRASMKALRAAGVDNRQAARMANAVARGVVNVDFAETTQLMPHVPAEAPRPCTRPYSDIDNVKAFYAALRDGDLFDADDWPVALTTDVYRVYVVWCRKSAELATSMPRLIHIFRQEHDVPARRKRYLLPGSEDAIGPHSVLWFDRQAQPPADARKTAWLGERIAQFRAAADDYCTADD